MRIYGRARGWRGLLVFDFSGTREQRAVADHLCAPLVPEVLQSRAMSGPISQTMEENFTPSTMGAGPGLVMGIPLKDKDNMCRSEFCCLKGGCVEKFDIWPMQFWCLKVDNGKPELITGIPMVAEENFCNARCCCVEERCTPFEVALQVYCCRCIGDGPK